MAPRSVRALVTGIALVASGSLSLHAQTFITWDGTSTVIESTGSPDPGLCNYPDPQWLGDFQTVGIPSCPTLTSVGLPGPSMIGGTAYDQTTDTVYVSDGLLVASYTAEGAAIDVFTSPGLVVGLGFDSTNGRLWATDGGNQVYAFAPPTSPACGAAVPFAVAPFNVPFLNIALNGIDWDPHTQSLWTSDNSGFVQNFREDGSAGPFLTPFFAGLCFASYPGRMRIAVDDATPYGAGHLYLSDGLRSSSILAPGVEAAPTFAFPGDPTGSACTPHPVPIIGFAFAARGLAYGTGVDPDGLPAPVGRTTGPSTTPGLSFAHTLSSAVPNGVAILAWSPSSLCPAPIAAGVPILIDPAPPAAMIAVTLVPPSGSLSVPTPIPPNLPVGTEIFTQWFVLKPAGSSLLQVSNGMGFRLSAF